MVLIAAATLGLTFFILHRRFSDMPTLGYFIVVGTATVLGILLVVIMAIIRAAASGLRADLHAAYQRQETLNPVCPNCSYNLTGNTSGTCPECGTAVPKKLEATT
jgi:hypothetical protein